jgi:hypothetical protein
MSSQFRGLPRLDSLVRWCLLRIQDEAHYQNLLVRVDLGTTVPVDFPDILSAIAPCPLLVVAPALDWHHPQGKVSQAIEAAKSTYNSSRAADKLQIYKLGCLAEFDNDIQSHITHSSRPLSHFHDAIFIKAFPAGVDRLRVADRRRG